MRRPRPGPIATLLAATALLPVAAMADLDGDGVEIPQGDCDDLRAWVRPGAGELCDGLDGDCDGAVPPGEADADLDGWRPCAGDCDDADALRHPHAPEACDGVDTDCDGEASGAELDVDGDGQPPCAGDCDDDLRSVRLGALEQCDGSDNDCDALIDEGCEPAGDDDSAGEPSSCVARGCGWSSGSQGALLLPALPFAWLARRRRGAHPGR